MIGFFLKDGLSVIVGVHRKCSPSVAAVFIHDLGPDSRQALLWSFHVQCHAGTHDYVKNGFITFFESLYPLQTSLSKSIL